MKNINWTEYFRLKLISIYHNLNDDESAIELLKQGEEETKARGDKYLLVRFIMGSSDCIGDILLDWSSNFVKKLWSSFLSWCN